MWSGGQVKFEVCLDICRWLELWERNPGEGPGWTFAWESAHSGSAWPWSRWSHWRYGTLSALKHLLNDWKKKNRAEEQSPGVPSYMGLEKRLRKETERKRSVGRNAGKFNIMKVKGKRFKVVPFSPIRLIKILNRTAQIFWSAVAGGNASLNNFCTAILQQTSKPPSYQEYFFSGLSVRNI